MLFHWEMRVAFIEKSVFANQIGFRESLFHLAEFKRHLFMNIAAVSIFVDPGLVNHYAFFNRRNSLQPLIFDFD